MEITAPAGYLLDSTPMEVSFTYEGQQIAWQVVDGTNTNLRTTVDISKQDIANGKELPGASWKSVLQTAIWWRAGPPQKRRTPCEVWSWEKRTP